MDFFPLTTAEHRRCDVLWSSVCTAPANTSCRRPGVRGDEKHLERRWARTVPQLLLGAVGI